MSMILTATAWDWTEIAEGIFVSLLFVVGPIVTHAEARHRKREQESQRRHAEIMSAHAKVHKHLGIGEDE